MNLQKTSSFFQAFEARCFQSHTSRLQVTCLTVQSTFVILPAPVHVVSGPTFKCLVVTLPTIPLMLVPVLESSRQSLCVSVSICVCPCGVG